MNGKEWTEWIVNTLDNESKTCRDRLFMTIGAMGSLADDNRLYGDKMAVFDALDVLNILEKIAEGAR